MMKKMNIDFPRKLANAGTRVRLIFIYMCVILLSYECIFSFNSNNMTDVNINARNGTMYDDPRVEFSRSITSGEQKYLIASLNDEIKDKRLDLRRQHWILKTNESSSSQKNHTDKEKHEKDDTHNNSYLPLRILAEIQPFSVRHGFNQTSYVDRVTVSYIHASAESGSSDSQFFMGIFHLYGLTQSPANMSKAVDWFNRASEGGHADAQCTLGIILYHGVGRTIEKDHKSAMRWFHRASMDSNHPRGHWLLGRSLFDGTTYSDIGINYLKEQGKDVSKQEKEGVHTHHLNEVVRLFELAANDNVPEAIHHLAVMYEYGLITSCDDSNDTSEFEFHMSTQKEPNFSKAAQLYKKAADIGWVESSYNLGLMYLYGRGVPLNDALAIDYFRQGVLNKHAPSMRYLGILAMNGQGQPHEVSNTAEALYWFEQCSMSGSKGGTYSDTGGSNNLCRDELAELETMVDLAEAYKKMVLSNTKLHSRKLDSKIPGL